MPAIVANPGWKPLDPFRFVLSSERDISVHPVAGTPASAKAADRGRRLEKTGNPEIHDPRSD
jgi:hypothetical protein